MFSWHKKKFFKTASVIFMLWLVFSCSFTSIFPVRAAVGIHDRMTFQGKVVNSNGTNVTDNSYTFEFKIYDGAESTANTLWTETWSTSSLFSAQLAANPAQGAESISYDTDSNESTIKVGQYLWNTTKTEKVLVTSINTETNTIGISPTRQDWDDNDTITNKIYVKDGIFNVELNSLNASWGTIDWTSDSLFLGVNFNSDGEMKPRKRLTMSPYAKSAGRLTATGNDVTTGNINSTSFTSATSLTGSLTGLNMDLSTNVTDGNNQVTGIALTLPDSGSATSFGLYVSGEEANYFSGSVGIGTTSPSATLDVAGNALLKGSNNYINFGTVSGESGYGVRDNSGIIQFKNSGGSWIDILGGSGTVNSGLAGRLAFYIADGTVVDDATGLFWDSGNSRLGLGSTSPADDIHLYKDSATTATLLLGNSVTGQTASDGLKLQLDASGLGYLLNQESQDLILGSYNQEAIRIGTSGLVGIGTTNPSARLAIGTTGPGVNILDVWDGDTNTVFSVQDYGATTFKPSSFDYVYYYNGSTYTDQTTEAKTTSGTAFTMLSTTSSFLYLGLNHPFNNIYVDRATGGVGITLQAEYYASGGWTALSISDDTANLANDGLISFTAPANWVTNSVNSQTKYWVRLSTSTSASTSPTAYITSPTSGTRFSIYAQSGDSTPSFYMNDQGTIYINKTISHSSTFSHSGAFRNTYISAYNYLSSSSQATNTLLTLANANLSSSYEDDYPIAVSISPTWDESVGDYDHVGLNLIPTLNQTGSSTGDYSVLRIRPTLTTTTGTKKYLFEAGTNNTTDMLLLDDSGNLNADQGTFYVDASNSRVGVGVTAPATLLSVGAASALQIDSSGNLNTSGTLQSTGNITTSGDVSVNGADLLTTASTFNLINTTATTLNIGGDTTTLNLAGSYTSTGCTIDSAGNLTCSGNITGGSTGNIGYWTRTGTTLSPLTAGDNVTTSGNISTTSTGTMTSAGLFTASNGFIMSTGALSMTSTSGTMNLTLTSQLNALNFDAGTFSLDSSNNRVGIGTTNPIGMLSVGATSQFQVSSAGAVTAVGVNAGAGLLQGALGLTVSGATTSINASSNFNTNINTGTSTGAVSIGNAAAGAVNLASDANSSFTVTTGDLTLSTSTSGTLAVTSAGALNLTSAAASTWNLVNSTVNSLSVESGLLSFDTLNARIGIGTTNPVGMLSVGTTSQFQVSSAGAVTAVGVNSGAGLLQGALGLTVTGATASINASSNFATNINTGTSTGAVSIGNAAAGAVSLASDANSSFTVTTGDLTLSTSTSGTLAVTSAGALNLTSAAASTWNLVNSTVNSLSVESGLLSFDTSNSRVGIGTTNPTHKIELASATTAAGGLGFGSDTEIYRTAAGKMRMGAAGLTRNNYLNIDFAQDWEWGVTLTVAGGAAGYNNLRFGSNTIFGNDVSFTFGDASQTSFQLNTAGGSNKHYLALQTFLSGDGINASGYISILHGGDESDADRIPAAAVADPHLRIYSSDNTQAADYIEFFHNQTNANIKWGNGSLVFNNGSDQMTLNSSGYLGIGTTNPAYALDVPGLSTETKYGIKFGTDGLLYEDGSGMLHIENTADSSTDLILGTYAQLFSGALYVDYKGGGIESFDYLPIGQTSATSVRLGSPSINVGIGTTFAPAYGLDVLDNTASTYAARIFHDGNSTNRYGLIVQAGLDTPTTVGNKLIQFNDGDGTGVGSITFNSTQTYYNTNSDIRLKENITGTHFTLEDLMKIKVRDYNFISDPDKTLTTGFIAQELFEIYPQAVTIPSDDNGYWSVDYGKLTPLLVKAAQDQQTEIEALQSIQTTIPKDAWDQGAFVSVNTGLAEWYQAEKPAAMYSPGDVVCLNQNNRADLCAENNQRILGVVVEQPAFLAGQTGQTGNGNKIKVAFAGTVKVNISPASFTAVGDIIAPSSTLTGYAQKLDGAGYALGRVTEIDSTTGEVKVALNIGYHQTDEYQVMAKSSLEEIKVLGSETENLKLIINEASKSGTLNLTNGGNEATIAGSLAVLGKTTTHDLAVINNASFGLLDIDGMDSSINSLGGPLKIESTALEAIEFQGGKIIMDRNGNFTTEGELTAKKINVGSESTGQAEIAEGETSVQIKTNLLTENSLIFATPIDFPIAISTKKIDVDKFEIKIQNSISSKLKINWWIIN